jgi:phosphoglycolate phosphatase-like HAD superfamily hydrolase
LALRSKIQVIVFDCDGVILDSVDVKIRAFVSLFEEYGEEIVQNVVEYHVTYSGLSRYEKFRYYYNELLGREITDQIMGDLDRRFTRASFDGVMKAPFIKGAYEFISEYYNNWPLYVASSAPEKKLKEIFRRREIDFCFKGIYGSPVPKKKNLKRIVAEAGVSPRQTLMIGDSNSDLEAAQAVGTVFLGRGPFPEPWPWVKDLTGLIQYIE